MEGFLTISQKTWITLKSFSVFWEHWSKLEKYEKLLGTINDFLKECIFSFSCNVTCRIDKFFVTIFVSEHSKANITGQLAMFLKEAKDMTPFMWHCSLFSGPFFVSISSEKSEETVLFILRNVQVPLQKILKIFLQHTNFSPKDWAQIIYMFLFSSTGCVMKVVLLRFQSILVLPKRVNLPLPD